MNKKLDNIVNSDSFSGVVLIREKDKDIYQGCNGYRDRANKLEIDIDTKFGIASGTKLFTALGIMRLVEDGEIQLEDKAFDYIDDTFPTYDKNITIKHLMIHTSGLPDYCDEDALKDGEILELSVPNQKLLKPSDYLPVMPRKEMKFSPDTDFNYNNGAFVFLAIIIEKLTGDYHKYIQEEVLDKANMNSSGFFFMNELPSNTAFGYLNDDVTNLTSNIYDIPIVGGGDGGMFTTVKDMDLFWNAFMNGDIVAKETALTMIKEHSRAKNLSYGLGVWLERSNEGLLPLIIGQDVGVSFESGYHPKKKRTYTIISNTESGAWKVSSALQEENGEGE